jgi:hypothetical protein
MFYWLDSFTQRLSSFFHQGMSSNPISCIVFNILCWFNQICRQANGLARHSQQVDMTWACHGLIEIAVRVYFLKNDAGGPLKPIL